MEETMKNYIKILLLALLAIPMAQCAMQLPQNVNDLIVKAARQGNIAFLQNPAHAGKLIMIRDMQNNNLLHMAAANGQLEAVKFLNEHRVNKNAKNTLKQTPAELAHANGHHAIAAYLSGVELATAPLASPSNAQNSARDARLYSKQLPRPTPQSATRPLPPIPQQPPAPAVHAPMPGNSKAYIPKGLHNGTGGLGNRCFINAAIQCLYSLEDVTNNAQTRAELYHNNPLIQSYLTLTQELKSTNQATLDPQEFCLHAWHAIHENPGQQHDSAELAQNILDQLIEPTAQSKNNELQRLCTTALTSTILGGNSQTIHETVVPLTIAPNAKKLEDCLAALSDIEMVELDGQQQPKILHLENTSKYLALSLKRTIYNNDKKSYEKNLQPVAFPLSQLCLTPYAQKNMPSYALKSCIIHVGDAGGGHYCAYARHGSDWYYCDDATVTKISDEQMQAIANRGYGATQQYLPIAFFYERI
jgi:hypothetical protein